MKTYIRLHLQHNSPEVIPKIIDGIKEAVVCNVTIKEGNAWVEVLSDKDLMYESFALGLLNAELSEKYQILNPYLWELINVEDDE